MSKRNKKQSKIKQFLMELQRKKRIIVLDQITFEEKRVFTTSKLALFIYSSFIFISLLLLFFIFISITSLKTFIPGYPNPTENQALLDKQIFIDNQLEAIIQQQEDDERYIKNLKELLNGSIPTNVLDSFNKESIQPQKGKNDVVSESEKSLREKVKNREKYEIDVFQGGALSSDVLPELLLYPPIKGEITNKLNVSNGHFGIDIIAPKNEAVMAILKGTIINNSWSPENGHVIHIQHKKNLISVYKHNSETLKSMGESVDAGEPIAIVGNSGTLSEGPHLHFELWHNGFPIDPEKFINFK